jgi:small ligand-binding sensory domain FIST
MMSPAAGPAMRWASALSTTPDAAVAAAEAATALQAALGEEPVDLALAFFTGTHVERAESIASVLKSRLAPGCLAGVSAHGVISSAHEIESGPALTVVGARLPGVRVSPFLVMNELWANAAADALEFGRLAPEAVPAELVILVGDPFSLDMERVLAAFESHAPRVRLVGGLASAGVRPKSNALFLNDWLARDGGFGIAFRGALRVDVVVSQGCRPIGPPLEVTRAQGNVVIELDHQPALARAEQVLQGLAAKERTHLERGLYVGRPVRAGASERGDYLIRNLLGADRDQGVIAIGDQVAERERIRLHVRDAETAREDLELLLAPQEFDVAAGAALLFTCNGRGRGLYGRPDGDISILRSALGGAVPAGGMFCAGEIGPVGARNFLHGHTASLAIVRPGTRATAAGGGT